MRDFLAKCWIFEEKMHDLPLNGGFSRRKMHVFGVKREIFEEKMRDFCLNA